MASAMTQTQKNQKPKTSLKNLDSAKALNQKVSHYETLTAAALKKIKIQSKLSKKNRQTATDFLEMAQNYFSDAKYFKKQGELLIALAAFSYAHAWLDAGVRIGVLDAQNDGRLFVLPK